MRLNTCIRCRDAFPRPCRLCAQARPLQVSRTNAPRHYMRVVVRIYDATRSPASITVLLATVDHQLSPHEVLEGERTVYASEAVLGPGIVVPGVRKVGSVVVDEQGCLGQVGILGAESAGGEREGHGDDRKTTPGYISPQDEVTSTQLRRPSSILRRMRSRAFRLVRSRRVRDYCLLRSRTGSSAPPRADHQGRELRNNSLAVLYPHKGIYSLHSTVARAYIVWLE
ncbi:hypothetical protein K466DRAFT_59959 [Polyporus arcularius HHB13444]|uniref:Uncharacterized protein n=1 Tax=Polyporus arcularius HHB13444 TaxID=1314778 RepID=A0A5C3PWA9_9APHY|nr:hypothetical protein K466DRAFT_59959 [Polyporus arcularius HHB13444]